jgi:exodeoxyribonuclease VII large subunit
VGVYERDGAYQLYVSDIIPEGAGKAGAALEQLKKKLAKEGIFDAAHKRPLPEMPRKIGVVTSLSGAAVRDVINVLTRRYPLCEVYAVNALVQGESAPDSVGRGILGAEQAGCDVVIVGRGGGSSEDLSAFNTEKVAYAVYNCAVPVISAVGHETDFTVADLAADMRAPTPSAAAELASPSVESLRERIDQLGRRAERAALSVLDKASDNYITLNARLNAQSPGNRMKLSSEQLVGLEKRLRTAMERHFDRLSSQLDGSIARLEALSPLKVLSRGYAIASGSGGAVLRRAADAEIGEKINVRLGDGSLGCRVEERKENDGDG